MRLRALAYESCCRLFTAAAGPVSSVSIWEQSNSKLYSIKDVDTFIAGHNQISLAMNSEAHTVADMYSMVGKRETLTIAVWGGG